MTDKPANRMWGGRFTASPAEIMEEINASIGFDKRLAPQDIRASKAHAAMLAEQGIIGKDDAAAIIKGLDAVLAEIDSGKMAFSRALEDVHMNVESRLKEVIGTPAGRLHTARSRNDQVATDFKLYVRERLDALDEALAALQLALRPQGRGACGDGHARLHASAAGAARHVRTSSAGLCGDVRPRSRPARRCAQAAERVPARLGGPRRHVVPHRPGGDGEGARLRQAHRQLARRRLRPRLRLGGAGAPLRSLPCICRALPRRSCFGRRRSSASSSS